MQARFRYAIATVLSLVATALLATAATAGTEEKACIRVAVLPFDQLHERAEDEFMKAGFAETLTTALARVRTLQVVERGQIRRVLQEQKLQQSGLVDTTEAAEIGKMLGAAQVLLGSYMRAGATIKVECRFVDVTTGVANPDHTATLRQRIADDDDLLDLLDLVAAKVIEGFSEQVTITDDDRRRAQDAGHQTVSTAHISAFQFYTEAREKFLLYTPEGYAAAVPLYEKAIAVDDDYALAWAGLAETLGFWGYQKRLNGEDATDDYRRALAAAQKAVALKPDLSEAYRALAEAYSHIGDEGDSAEARSRKRVEAARKAIALNERDAEAHYMLWLATGRALTGEGFVAIRTALEINPRLIAAHNDLGVRYQEAGRYDDAMRHYQAALEANQRDPNTLNNIGNCHLEQGRLDDAVAAYQKALAIDPDDAYVHNNYGKALQRLERYDEALAEYQRAIAINPRYANAHYNLGIIHRRQGNLDQAEAAYQRAIAINDQDPAYFNALGTIYRMRHDYDRAIETYRKALALDENNSVAWYYIGHSLSGKAGQSEGEARARLYDLAVEAFRTCARLDPADADPWYDLGVIYGEQKQVEASIAAYRKAVALNEQHTNAWYNLAWQLHEKGDKKAAIEAMRRFLALAREDDSQKEWIPRAEKFLRDNAGL